MRPSGLLHLGHYKGVLQNWLKLQYEYSCLFFVADWHALTTHYQHARDLPDHVRCMVIDWLAVGVDPEQAVIFVQSHVVEHAELFLVLSMLMQVSRLERVPTYKDRKQRLAHLDLSTYGFLGYPLLQAADILLYRARYVPVGEDQLPHLELCREIARRFNHLYGGEVGFEKNALLAAKKMGSKRFRLYLELRTRYQEQGVDSAYHAARALVTEQQNLSLADRERLLGYLDGAGRKILIEPDVLLSGHACFPGLDGHKMSKSSNNGITLREDPAVVANKIRKMPTDPARVRLKDPGDPNKCPVFSLHRVYSSEKVKDWVVSGCCRATIGCLECKQPLIDAINSELAPIRERAQLYEDDPVLVRNVLADGCERARHLAQETLMDVRNAVGLTV